MLALACAFLQTTLLVLPVRAQSLGEALDAPGLTWSTSGDVVWFGQTIDTHDGVDAVQSGSIGDSQSSDLVTLNVQGPVSVAFW